MNNKFTTKLISLILALTMVLSIVPMATVSSNAALSLTSLDGWLTNQLYARGLKIAGDVFNGLTGSVENEEFQYVCSLINKYVFDAGNTGEKLSAIQNTCDEILKMTENTYSVVNDINKKISSNTITASQKDCDEAFENQVMAYATKYDESSYDFLNVYIAYLEYLNYACDCDDTDDEDLVFYEEANLNELRSYYAGVTNDFCSNPNEFDSQNEYYDFKMYTTNALDVCITGMIKSMLNNMDPNYSGVSNGRRFIDYAAQYAYYAYPYSNEQAQFVDYAVEHQINVVTTMLMVYQDIVAHRADYLEKCMVDEETEVYYKKTWTQLAGYYDNIIEKTANTIEKYLNGKIYLPDVKASTTLDKYARNESVSNLNGEKVQSFSLTNTSFLDKRIYNSNQCDAANFTSKSGMSFYKNVSVTAKNGELKFTPFYVLNGDALDKNQMHLTAFDLNDEDSWGSVFGGLYDTHYLHTDYYNLTQGNYTDGLNSYGAISDASMLKNCINNTYYSANDVSPYSYFAPYLSYSKNNPTYLLLNGKPELSKGYSGVPPFVIEETRYTSFPVFNMSSENSFANNWSGEMMSQYNLQYDRKESENKTNSMYAVIFAPKSDETKVNIDTELYGEGEITVAGENSTTAVAGEKVEVNITAPENHSITEIRVTYNNGDDEEEKVIYSGIGPNEMTFDYPVPYSDITITVQTANVPQPLPTDEEGNYEVSNYSDLQQMAKMVNSGYEEYAEANYVVTNSFKACDNGFLWSTGIGTNDSPFSGTFDGQGFTISDLWFDEYSTEENFGLFGVIDGGEVENISVDMPQGCSSAHHYTQGTICGYIKNGSIEDCSATGLLCVEADYAGGIVGIAENSSIEECKTQLSVTSGKYCFFDDICGYSIDSEIEDCVSENSLYIFPY